MFLDQIEKGHYNNYYSQLENIKSIQKHLSELSKQPMTDRLNAQKAQLEIKLKNSNDWIKRFGGVEILFNNVDTISNNVNEGNYLMILFDAKRLTDLRIPGGIRKVNLKKKYKINELARQDFVQYIVNLKADKSFARDDGENEVVKEIDEWFAKLESRLQTLFDSPKLKLKFDRKSYNFEIIEDDKLPFGFNTLAGGYSAIITIVTELLLRMEGHGAKAYDLEGVVLIDEIETHLHVELQKKVLPFLIDFFPKIQFIVTTHSPFVLSSVSNAVVCDLEALLVTEDLSGYSYDALIESYFNTDKYSEEIKKKILLYDELASQKQLDSEQEDELRQLRNYFAHVPKYLSKELMVKLQQIELQNLQKRNKK